MPSLNRVSLMGYVGRNPEIKTLASGSSLVNFSMATTERWRDQASGTWQEKTEWHNLVAFGRVAEICGEYVQKGSFIYVEGRLQTRKWEDKNGAKRQNTSVVVNTLKMLSRKAEGQGEAPDEAGPPADNSDVPF